jgi:hypothetical protein
MWDSVDVWGNVLMAWWWFVPLRQQLPLTLVDLWLPLMLVELMNLPLMLLVVLLLARPTEMTVR